MARRGSGGALFEPADEKRDRELTLGPATLAILAVGLLTLCGVCFVFGYAVGHHSSSATPGVQQALATTQGSALSASNQPKPSASEDPFQPSPAPQSNGATPNSATTPSTGGATSPAATVPASATGAAPAPAPALMQTALPATHASGQPIAPSGLVHPALPQQGPTWTVQVAAVSQSEDANVLLVALRRRGYNVSVRRDPSDNLMHVQVGPFTNHNDAAAMRQRLLNDGYNAILEP